MPWVVLAAVVPAEGRRQSVLGRLIHRRTSSAVSTPSKCPALSTMGRRSSSRVAITCTTSVTVSPSLAATVSAMASSTSESAVHVSAASDEANDNPSSSRLSSTTGAEGSWAFCSSARPSAAGNSASSTSVSLERRLPQRLFPLVACAGARHSSVAECSANRLGHARQRSRGWLERLRGQWTVVEATLTPSGAITTSLCWSRCTDRSLPSLSAMAAFKVRTATAECAPCRASSPCPRGPWYRPSPCPT
jgi:hypothetical protein